jgi:hypothetical protein
MDSAITPDVGVGSIRFGMSKAEVRGAVGAPSRPFRRSPFEDRDAGAFIDLGMFVYYREPGVCAAVEFGGSAIPTFDGAALLGRPFRAIYEFLVSRDPALEVHATGLTSLQCGIGIYMSSLKEDKH